MKKDLINSIPIFVIGITALILDFDFQELAISILIMIYLKVSRNEKD